jgi:hypothetical protein
MSTTPRTDQTEREMDAADLKPQLRLPLYANLARNLEHECSALHELVSVLGDEAARLHKKVMTRKANNIALDRRNKRLAAALESPCSAFIALMAGIERIRDRARQYAEDDEAEENYEDAVKQRKIEGTLNEILRIGKVLESNLSQNNPLEPPAVPRD